MLLGELLGDYTHSGNVIRIVTPFITILIVKIYQPLVRLIHLFSPPRFSMFSLCANLSLFVQKQSFPSISGRARFNPDRKMYSRVPIERSVSLTMLLCCAIAVCGSKESGETNGYHRRSRSRASCTMFMARRAACYWPNHPCLTPNSPHYQVDGSAATWWLQRL